MVYIWWPGNPWVTFQFIFTVLLSAPKLRALDERGKEKKRNGWIGGKGLVRGRSTEREREIEMKVCSGRREVVSEILSGGK